MTAQPASKSKRAEADTTPWAVNQGIKKKPEVKLPKTAPTVFQT
jgi:hypothetical protein